MKKIYLAKMDNNCFEKPTVIIAENIEEASRKLRDFLKKSDCMYHEIREIYLFDTAEVIE